MNLEKETRIRLLKLERLLQTVRDHKLGLDWESKREFSELEEKIKEEIKSILTNRNMVK